MGELEGRLRTWWRIESGMGGCKEKRDSVLGLQAHDFLAIRMDSIFLPSKLGLHFLRLEFPPPRFHLLKCCLFFRAHSNAAINSIRAQ